ncbi:DUF1573 domain-containing protein [Mucilaginibacter hurinus]|uniref:DUF1573 domain-containing protein n=1 Tax=Mucilaginibacter hurinus TaxID=2201324 RepID=A0A367GMX1_9SPHI|nr:DUF1573 domain-containing protein [Mucilaginibacter hurinus]RCH54031.1 DUF1573 domain-containing protein [Mucilaginibacter hurinus]
MKKLFLTFIAASTLLAACQSNSGGSSADSAATAKEDSIAAAKVLENPVDSANAPVLKFAVESYNFGKVDAGKKVEYEYEFTNTGKSPLVIQNATASCGCTVPAWPKKPILPGEGGKIKVSFDSANKSGMQDKLITITGNTIPAQTVVHLVGEVTGDASAPAAPGAPAPGTDHGDHKH